jgi:ribonuclease BN (tRNA processing enzyme)
MELIVLGAGPAYTDRHGAAAACQLIRHGGAALLLDMGQGAFPNLAAVLEPSTLTAIAISHLHPDHFIDLVPLRHYLRYEFDPPRRLRILAPAALTDRLDGLHGEAGFAAATLDVEALAEGSRQIGPFELEARLVPHTEESYAFRVTPAGAEASGSLGSGKPAPGLVYSGDCARAGDLVPLIRPGDTLLSEASFGATEVPPGAAHLTARDAARAASAGRAARLLLTHLQMGFDRADALAAAQGIFAGPTQLVTEGDRFEI